MSAHQHELIITLPTLHADQVLAYAKMRGQRFFALRCGRRWGKTDFEATIGCDDAIKGLRVGLFAPDYKRLNETYAKIEEILSPIKKSASQTAGLIKTTTNGLVEFWTLQDESAGRSRKYHTVLIDEAAFAKVNMMDIWQRAIKPTLLDYRGRCIAASNTAGDDPENFFWQICNEARHGFVEYHAPSIKNPYLPADEIERLRLTEHPLVFKQEYEAEFVDWSGVAFFSLDKMLIDGQPVQPPMYMDVVFAVIDTATKTGTGNDGTGCIYFGLSKAVTPQTPLYVLDYELMQIEGSLLENWLPTVFQNLENLAARYKARRGSAGALIEDKSSGMVLLQQAQRRNWPATPIDTKLTAMGKDERAISVSGHHYQGRVKLSPEAFNKTLLYKGTTRNHLISQVTGFRVGDKEAIKAKRPDDLLDCYCYGLSVGLGNAEGW